MYGTAMTSHNLVHGLGVFGGKIKGAILGQKGGIFQ